MEPDPMPEIGRLFIQPTQKPSTTKSDDSSLSKTLLHHRREGQVSPLGERATDGKENKPLKYLSKGDDHEDEQQQSSHQDDEYVSSKVPTKFFYSKLPKPLKYLSKDDDHEDEQQQSSHQDDEYVSSKVPTKFYHSKLPKPLKYLSKDDDHEDEQQQSSHQDDEHTSSNEPTEFGNSKIPFYLKTLFHRLEGQVSRLGGRVAGGKGKKPLKYLSKDDDHENEQQQSSHQDDEYVSSKVPTKFYYSKLPSSDHPSSSSKTILHHRREGQLSPLGESAADEKENQYLKYIFSKDDDHKNEQQQPSHEDDEYFSSNETWNAMDPDTTEIKPEIECLLIQPRQYPLTTGFDSSILPSYHTNLPSSPMTLVHRREGQAPALAADREDEEDGKKDMPLKRSSKDEEDMPLRCSSKDEENNKDKQDNRNEQFKMYDDELLSDIEEESDEEPSTQDGWIGNGDQIADLELVLRWARAYKVSIVVAGRMLKMKPEIVNRALMVHAQSTDPDATEEVVVPRPKPVIKNWLKLGPM